MATPQDREYYPQPPLMDHVAGASPYASTPYNFEVRPGELSYKQPPASSTSNSRSYASRAGIRPDLFIDTSTPGQESAGQSPTSPMSLDEPYDLSSPSGTIAHKPRQSSVSDKSPLQSLEVKLGDISKGEKRARAEKAEYAAQHRYVTRREKESQSSRALGAQDIPNSGSDPVYPNAGQSARRSSRTVDKAGSAAITSPGNPTSIPYASSRPRIRSYGYDSSLTGGAAAAAVDAYQASRRPRYDPQASATNGIDSPYFSRSQNANMHEQPSINQYSATQLGNNAQPDLSQPQSSSIRVNNRSVSAPQQHDSDRREPARFNVPMPHANNIAPQTVAGQQARKQVAFQTDQIHDPQDDSWRGQEDGDRHRFRSMFQRGRQQGRRYEEPEYLEEWSNAETVTLTSAELELDSNTAGANDQAWWERNERQDAQDQGNFNISRGNGIESTTFSPPLTLKCGPLLRYTGIRMDNHTEKEFWRGSVMIVTQDAASSYRTTPVLRLFKQSVDLTSPPDQGGDYSTHGSYQRSANVDTIAGLPKMSRTGGTLVVKPINEVQAEMDLSNVETDQGLFLGEQSTRREHLASSQVVTQDGEKQSRFREVHAIRLYAERGVTFWRFNLQVELTEVQNRIAYRINGGPAVGFWIPARGQVMNTMFHSCNGFSLSVNSNEFCGPDPLWRDVLNNHQIRPFHCMIGGGDQIYNDAAMKQTQHFQEWLAVHNPEEKHSADFSMEMQDELEQFYLDRYAMWFSQGLFGMANSQIPMVNMWDDHDIIDGFGSYPHHFMSTPVFSGVGAVAFKYYMLFQQQSVPDESEQSEPSWLLGAAPGPYIHQLSRSIFVSLGKGVSFLGLDCRMERMRDEVLSQGTYDLIFDRCHREIIQGETRHLIVLLGVPIAYPRLNFLENVLTSRAMDPIKALGRAGLFAGFVNKFDGGVEILDDLDDHWTAKHHKHERNWFIQELQELAAEKSVRITILGGDVHLAAVGQFYSNPKLGVPKDHDHRYMPNVISSAMVNTPPPEMMADVLNKRNKVHHLDKDTDEDMIPLFTQDVTGKTRNNTHLLPRRNWCLIREYKPGTTPPITPPPEREEDEEARSGRRRSFSFSRSRSRSRLDGEKKGLLRRFSSRKAPPSSYHGPNGTEHDKMSADSDPAFSNGGSLEGSIHNRDGVPSSRTSSEDTPTGERGRNFLPRSNSFHRRPSKLTRKASRKDPSGRGGEINIEGGLDIILNCEIDRRDPAGFTFPYRLIIPALSYQGAGDESTTPLRGSGISGLLGSLRRPKEPNQSRDLEAVPYDDHEVRSTPPLGGRAMPESAIVSDGTTRNSNVAVLPDSDFPSNQPPPTFKGPVPTPLEEPTTLPGPEPAPTTTNGSGILKQKRASNTMPLRSASTRESDTRPTPLRRWSGSGPAPPENIDQLPASVRKRYSQLNDPEVKEYTQKTDPARKRYSQMSDPAAYKRFSQYEPLSGSGSGFQRHSNPAPLPKPEDTHRRYSSGPMEMPLLPTNVNQLRSSTHRTLQDTWPSFDPEQAQRSVSDPQPASTSSAYEKPSPGLVDSMLNTSHKSQLPSAIESYHETYVSTATAPSMVPLSRGQAKTGTNIPTDPSPLTSHAPQRDSNPSYNSQTSPTANVKRVAINPTRPLGREYDDAVYGYRHSNEEDDPRGSWRHSMSGVPDKFARLAGYDVPQESGGSYGTNDGRGSKGRSSGLGGLMRRVSESAASRRQKRADNRVYLYNNDWDDGSQQYGYNEEYEKSPGWKFWQR